MIRNPRKSSPVLRAERSIQSAVGSGVPVDAVAFFARWWELETFLRELVYLEMSASRGQGWQKFIDRKFLDRAEQDVKNRYMDSPDADNPLAYLDTSALFRLIGSPECWPLCEPSLLPRVRWEGFVDALTDLRNRNAHARRPHADDLARLEQALRDLEPGARTAFAAFNRQERWWEDQDDPVATAWVTGEHEDARRLVAHAERRYGIDFALWSSDRPWSLPVEGPISGLPGHLWHAEWVLHDGRFLSPREFWLDSHLDRPGVRDLIVHVVQDHDALVSVSFAAVDEPVAVSNAIGACFDAVISASHAHIPERRRARWRQEATGLDVRVQVDSALSMMTDDAPFRIFGV